MNPTHDDLLADAAVRMAWLCQRISTEVSAGWTPALCSERHGLTIAAHAVGDGNAGGQEMALYSGSSWLA